MPADGAHFFDLLIDIFQQRRYNLGTPVDHGAVDAEALKCVNNDICYPSILVTGQIMEAVTSGRYGHRQAGPSHHADGQRLPVRPTSSR